MRKEEREVVADDLPERVDLDFFAKDADAAGTAKAGFVVGVLTQASFAGHGLESNTGDALNASSE